MSTVRRTISRPCQNTSKIQGEVTSEKNEIQYNRRNDFLLTVFILLADFIYGR